MKKKRLSRVGIYVIVISAFLLAVNVSLGYVLTRQSSAAMRSLIESRMLDVSNTAAALLDGDTLEALEADDKGTPEYQRIYKMLTCFEDNIELEYIYCVRDMGDGNFVFTIDPDAEAPGEFGEHIPYTDALYQASLGTAAVDKVPYADEWGRFYSAYSPVFDSQNRVAGIVAVDFSAEWYEKQITNHILSTLLISGISLLFAAIIIVFTATRYRERFGEMLEEMNVVSDGIETLVHEVSPRIQPAAPKEDAAARSEDEIAALGAKIHAMQEQLGDQIAFVRSQAYIDGLTGLGNRTAYEEHVQWLEDEIREGTAEFAIAVFDLNGLKEINDRFGHEKGDEAIIAAATAISKAFEDGRPYRIGGDEFIVILEGPHDDIPARAEGMAGAQAGICLSRGCAVYQPDADLGYHAVFNRADSAMYEDKKQYYQTHADRRKPRRAKREAP